MDKAKVIKIFEEVLEKYEQSEDSVIREYSISIEEAGKNLDVEVSRLKEQFYEALSNTNSLKTSLYLIGDEHLNYIHRCNDCQNIIELFARENYTKTLICECGIKYITNFDGSITKIR